MNRPKYKQLAYEMMDRHNQETNQTVAMLKNMVRHCEEITAHNQKLTALVFELTNELKALKKEEQGN